MKKLLLVFSLALLSFAKSDEPIERIGVKGPLKFNGTTFTLSWTDHPKDYYYIQEYLPENETSNHFNQMMTLHVFDKDVTAEAAMRQKIKELEVRKKTDQVCNYEVNESPDGTEFMVDFLLSQSSGDRLEIVEFNMYRYKKVPLNDHLTGILVYAYTKRAYGDDTTSFLTKIATERNTMLYQMRTVILPKLTISK